MGATITPAAPISMTFLVKLPRLRLPADEAPTITGTRPLTRAITHATKSADSCALSLGASPMTPRIVMPVTPHSR